MTKQQWGTGLIVVGAVGTALSMFSGNQPGLWFVSLVVLAVGLVLKFKK